MAVFGLVILLLLLGLVIGFWIGLFGLRGSTRGLTWWLMAAGLAAATIAPLLVAVGTFLYAQDVGSLAAFHRPSPGSPPMPTLLVAGHAAIPGGFLLFAAGFALHGLEQGRAELRAKELEELAASMDDELGRIRQAEPRA